MGGAVLYPHSILHWPSFSALKSRPKFGNSNFSLRDGPLISSIRADGNRERHERKASPEDNPRSSLSPNKEEILALFRRIQSSISKGETVDSKNRITKAAEDDKPSAESILEVIHQSRTRGKGKTSPEKWEKFQTLGKDLRKKEEKTEYLSTVRLKPTRPPSTFTRKSPVRTLSIPRDEIQAKNGALSATPNLSIPREGTQLKNESLHDDDDQQFKRFEEMKLTELKEIAKSKGIRGYSKLKKSELLELLVSSLNNASL